jgi:hypothetical protein
MQTPNERTCKTCHESLPMMSFLWSKGYHIWMCNLCRSAESQRNHEKVKNRAFNDLINGAFG